MVDVRATHFTAAELVELSLPGLPTTYEFPAHSATVLEIPLGQ